MSQQLYTMTNTASDQKAASTTARAVTRLAVVSLCVAVSLTGCSKIKKERVSFEGIEFRSSAKKIDKDRSIFYSETRPASKSLKGAIEAAEYEGIRYCIKNFGTSTIAWVTGPATDPALLQINGDTLRFEGECKV